MITFKGLLDFSWQGMQPYDYLTTDGAKSRNLRNCRLLTCFISSIPEYSASEGTMYFFMALSSVPAIFCVFSPILKLLKCDYVRLVRGLKILV